MNTNDYLTGLNDAQRAGVLHEGPPLFVLAGPGTGKTQLIINRVVHMVGERDINPETIVAMTFTNKAAEELRERLAQSIDSDSSSPMGGAAAADSVHAGTFHSFGLRLLRRFADLSGIGTNPEIIDSAQRRRLLRHLVDEHKIFGRLIALGSETLISESAAYIQTFRQHALSPQVCVQFANTWEHNLNAGLDSAGESLEDEKALRAQQTEQKRFLAHAKLFGLFEKACRARGWLTLDDLLTLPAQLLEKHESVRDICHNEYRHFVVDEFQDVNLAQIRLIALLAPPALDPDLVLVGDDDQAIYEFRGADEQAFARAKSIWTDATTLALTENYRSQQPVIDVANNIISRASQRFAPDKTIERAHILVDEPVALGAGVQIIHLQKDTQTGDGIAAMIRAALAKNPALKLSDIAVIARTHLDNQRIYAALDLEGIPAHLRMDKKANEDEGVLDVLAWIELLVNPQASWMVQRILRRPPLGIAETDCARWNRSYQRALRAAQVEQPEAEQNEVQQEYPAWLQTHASDHAGVVKFLARYHELFDRSQRVSASEAVWAIATRCDVVHADLLSGRARAKRIINIVRVLRFVRTVQPRLDAPGDLAALWAYYNDLDPKEKSFGSIGQEALDTNDDDENTQNAVQLISAHGSKGLEFDLVFLPRVNPGHGYPKTSGSYDNVRLPEGIVDRLGDTRTDKERRLAEERRIFYVACTRAKRQLVLITRKPKSQSTSENYTQELITNAQELVTVRDISDVLSPAQGSDELSCEADLAIMRVNLTSAALREARRAREVAAAAFDRLERADANPKTIETETAVLASAAARIATVCVFAAAGKSPAWADTMDEETAKSLARLETIRQSTEQAKEGPVFKSLTSPLTLSYSFLNDYIRCPACFYVKRVLNLGDGPSAQLTIGSLVHKLLEDHARAWQNAEAEGCPLPTLALLQSQGRKKLAALRLTDTCADKTTADELDAMLANAHEMMCADNAEILEVEHNIIMPYEINGQSHQMKAKLDRVDRIDAGVRIVDYKTGAASKSKLEPPAKDLQLGIYTMLIKHAMPDAGGYAQYWLVRTGERGTINFDDLAMDKIQRKIEQTVCDMLAGEFPRKPGTCSGLCDILFSDQA